MGFRVAPCVNGACGSAKALFHAVTAGGIECNTPDSPRRLSKTTHTDLPYSSRRQLARCRRLWAALDRARLPPPTRLRFACPVQPGACRARGGVTEMDMESQMNETRSGELGVHVVDDGGETWWYVCRSEQDA